MKRKVRSEKMRKRVARHNRVRTSISTADRPRLSVYRSNKHVYAQLEDAESGRTIASVSSRSKAVMGDVVATGNIEAAKRVGAAIAQIAREKDIVEVVFNRNCFLYHGRVKALAEAAREAGLRF
jgi:large subunit ribosomal protein L18